MSLSANVVGAEDCAFQRLERLSYHFQKRDLLVSGVTRGGQAFASFTSFTWQVSYAQLYKVFSK